MSKRLRGIVLPLLAAFIWGTAFVGQSVLTDVIPPFAVNALRGAIASLTLLLVIFLFRTYEKKKGRTPPKQDKRALLVGGVCAGAVLTIASFFQQAGLAYTSAGKASFITALYIVLVPLCGLVLGKKVSRNVALAVLLAVAGLYLISVKGGFTVEKGDLLIFLCALCFTLHILVIDNFSARVDGLCFSCVQFVTCMILSGIASLLTEEVHFPAELSLWLPPLLYIGVMSSGVAYTLQILAQKDGDPTLVSILLSLESVFGALSGAVLLHERMSEREILGCVLMFAAVLLSQFPGKREEADPV